MEKLSECNNFFDKISLDAKKKAEVVEQNKKKLYISIIVDWQQENSRSFWDSVFFHLDYDIILKVFKYTENMSLGGYRLHNRAAFFTHTLKTMGLYPFKKKEAVSV